MILQVAILVVNTEIFFKFSKPAFKEALGEHFSNFRICRPALSSGTCKLQIVLFVI